MCLSQVMQGRKKRPLRFSDVRCFIIVQDMVLHVNFWIFSFKTKIITDNNNDRVQFAF